MHLISLHGALSDTFYIKMIDNISQYIITITLHHIAVHFTLHHITPYDLC